MHVRSKPVSPPVHDEKEQPIAIFKPSLRAWQAEYKARLAALAIVSGKAPSETSPA